MSIESEIFKKYKLKESNLVPYGFIELIMLGIGVLKNQK